MNKVRRIRAWFVDSGITSITPEIDMRYIRFLNATLILFGFGQIPILALLISLGLWAPLQVNLAALAICALGFVINRHGFHLPAKIVIVSVVIANTAYFALVLGSVAPAHLWLIPVAVLGTLAFKPSEWIWATTLVGLSVIMFLIFEIIHSEITPVVQIFRNPLDELRSAKASTVFAMVLTLILVGMMHRRFAISERALSHEKSQSDRLLRAILPDKVARELRETGSTQALRHDDVSVLFADIVGFTPLAASMPAEDVVALLAEIFERFDALIEHCGVEKIKTIGDAYMVASGVPQPTTDHPERIVRCAFGMFEIMKQFSGESGHQLELRIGLHRGPVVAGVIGKTKFAYDLWGETVNLASRLESSGEPGRIQVSDAFKSGLDNTMNFELRGEITLKGVGMTRTHWLPIQSDLFQ